MPAWATVLLSLVGSAVVAGVPTWLTRRKTDAETDQSRTASDNSTSAEMREIYAVVERQRNEALAAAEEARGSARESRELAVDAAKGRAVAHARSNVCERNLRLLVEHMDAFEIWASENVPTIGAPPPPKRPELHEWPPLD